MPNPNNPVSPKVTAYFLVGLALTVAQLALTQDWSAGESYASVATVLGAALAYWVRDPARNV